MAIPKTIEGREYKKFVESPTRPQETALEVSIGNDIITNNNLGNEAVRVIITEPSAADQPAPTNIQLSQEEVSENLPVNTEVATITATGGVPPLVFTIEQDLSNAFQIVGNKLQTSRVLSAITEPTLNVAIRCTDNLGRFTTQNFTITVNPVSGFLNAKSYRFNGSSSFAVFPQRLHAQGSSASGDFSIGIWAKQVNGATTQTLISTFNADGITEGGVSLEILASGEIRLILEKLNGNNRVDTYSTSSINITEWNFFGISYSRQSSVFNFYINAALQTPSSSTGVGNIFTNLIIPDNDTYFGRAPIGNQHYDGFLDEIFFSPDLYEATDWTLAYNGGIAANLDDFNKNIDHWYRAEDDLMPIVLDVKGSVNGASSDVIAALDSPSGFQNNFSVLFDGATNYFIGSGVPDFLSAKTFSFWLNRDTPLQTDILFSFNAQTNNTNNAARIYMDSNSQQRIYFRIDSSSGNVIRRWSLGSGSINTWNHIVITASDWSDASTIQLYRNAILLTPNQTTNTLTVLPSITNKIAIGAGVTGGSLFNGKIDEYSVFDRHVNLAEVEELFNLGQPSNLNGISFFSDLIQWFRFGDKNGGGSVMESQASEDSVVMIGYDPSFYVAGVSI